MANIKVSDINVVRNAGEVLGRANESKEVELVSAKGTTYNAVVLPRLHAMIAGDTTINSDATAFNYSVFDKASGFNFNVKVAQKLDVSFGDSVELENVQMGVVNNNVWVKAEKISASQVKSHE